MFYNYNICSNSNFSTYQLFLNQYHDIYDKPVLDVINYFATQINMDFFIDAQTIRLKR